MIMISSKGRYALRVMTYLAVNADREFVPLKEIAEAESISLKYLESIARMLSKEHYIEGTSGRGGGYHLTRKPEAYKVGDILRLTEGTLAPVSCLKDNAEPCGRAELCCTLPVWQGLSNVITDYLDNMTLADVVKVHPNTIGFLNGLHLDYCCGGHDPIGQAVAARGLDVDKFLKDLNEAASRPAAMTNVQEDLLPDKID